MNSVHTIVNWSVVCVYNCNIWRKSLSTLKIVIGKWKEKKLLNCHSCELAKKQFSKKNNRVQSMVKVTADSTVKYKTFQ